MYTKCDFHIHSIYSDGKCTPQEVVIISKEKNIDIISLADHNKYRWNRFQLIAI